MGEKIDQKKPKCAVLFVMLEFFTVSIIAQVNALLAGCANVSILIYLSVIAEILGNVTFNSDENYSLCVTVVIGKCYEFPLALKHRPVDA